MELWQYFLLGAFTKDSYTVYRNLYTFWICMLNLMCNHALFKEKRLMAIHLTFQIPSFLICNEGRRPLISAADFRSRCNLHSVRSTVNTAQHERHSSYFWNFVNSLTVLLIELKSSHHLWLPLSLSLNYHIHCQEHRLSLCSVSHILIFFPISAATSPGSCPQVTDPWQIFSFLVSLYSIPLSIRLLDSFLQSPGLPMVLQCHQMKYKLHTLKVVRVAQHRRKPYAFIQT